MEVLTTSATKENLIKATARLIEQKGYFGTGINEILKVVGVPKGSLYHHFPGGKDDLVIAALMYAGKKQQDIYASAMKGRGSVEEALNAIIDILIDRIENSDYKRSCPISAVALEITSLNEPIQKTCADIFNNWENGLASFFAYKHIKDPENVAKLYMNLIEGAFLLSKTHKNISYLKLIKDQTAPIISRYK